MERDSIDLPHDAARRQPFVPRWDSGEPARRARPWVRVTHDSDAAFRQLLMDVVDQLAHLLAVAERVLPKGAVVHPSQIELVAQLDQERLVVRLSARLRVGCGDFSRLVDVIPNVVDVELSVLDRHRLHVDNEDRRARMVAA
eukprot:4837633-Prymnesium_polylepis.2